MANKFKNLQGKIFGNIEILCLSVLGVNEESTC